MVSYKEAVDIASSIDKASEIVVVQADNPDTDSLATSLALEQILASLGKSPTLYCGVDMPSYLHHLSGWDRVTKDLPKKFDLSIIVDTSSLILLEQLERTAQLQWLKAKPVIIIDHHISPPTIDFAQIAAIHSAVATGEIIYELARQLEWELNSVALDMIAIAILSDSLGLTSEGTTARSIHILAELVEKGVRLPELENARREMLRREPELVHYKGRLLQRVEYDYDNRVATLIIPWEEIEKYSALYNPSMLAIDDMRLARGTDIAICFKTYPDGRITAKIRANYGQGVADKLAEHFGGGGHPYASGFKVQNGKGIDEIKNQAVAKAIELLDQLNQTKSHEII